MNERTMKTGATPEEATALIAPLRSLMDLEDGELYTLRKGMLHRVSRNDDDNGLRRIKIMEAAYDAATQVAKCLRQRMRGPNRRRFGTRGSFGPDPRCWHSPQGMPSMLIKCFPGRGAGILCGGRVLFLTAWVFCILEPCQRFFVSKASAWWSIPMTIDRLTSM